MQVLCAVLSLAILVYGMAKTMITSGETPCSLFCSQECFRLIFMVAILTCLLLNKLDLFSLHDIGLFIQLVTLTWKLHISVCTETILWNPLYGFCIGIAVGGRCTG
jgi:hypothetical protein